MRGHLDRDHSGSAYTNSQLGIPPSSRNSPWSVPPARGTYNQDWISDDEDSEHDDSNRYQLNDGEYRAPSRSSSIGGRSQSALVSSSAAAAPTGGSVNDAGEYRAPSRSSSIGGRSQSALVSSSAAAAPTGSSNQQEQNGHTLVSELHELTSCINDSAVEDGDLQNEDSSINISQARRGRSQQSSKVVVANQNRSTVTRDTVS